MDKSKKNQIQFDNSDRLKVKHDFEILFLSFMLIDISFVEEIFSKIDFEELTELNRPLFEEIAQSKPFSQTWLYQTIKLFKPDYISDIDRNRENISIAANPKIELDRFINRYLIIQADLELNNTISNNWEKFRNDYKGISRAHDLIKSIEGILRKSERFVEVKSFDESLNEILQRLDDKLENKNCINTLDYPSFRNATGGLSEGNLVGIAGAFKNGKTTFGLNLLMDFVSQGFPSAIFSLEVSANEMNEKIFAYKTDVPYEKLRNPRKLNEQERASLMDYRANRPENEKLYIFDRVNTLSKIEAQARQLVQKQGLKILLVDYIGLLQPEVKSRNSESREREISLYSSSLKVLAKELGIIIIVLSQLNREGMKDANSTNLAESIALARDSDFLFTISQPSKYGIKSILINKGNIPIEANHFLVKLDASRHTLGGKQFLLELNDSGKMRELTTQFDNAYQIKVG